MSCRLNDRDKSNLRAFVRAAEKLLTHTAIADGGASFSVQVGTTVTSELATQEQLESLATRLRPFLLEKSKANFNRCRNVIGKIVCKPGGRHTLKVLKAKWRSALQKGMWEFESTNRATGETTRFTPEWVMDHYFYGDVFHADDQQLVSRLETIMANPLQKPFFIITLQVAAMQIANCVQELGGIVEHVLEKSSEPENYHYFAQASKEWALLDATSGLATACAAPDVAQHVIVVDTLERKDP